MTTPTPTSEPRSAAGLEAGLPDLGALTALANALFQAPPGSPPAAGLAPAAPTRPVTFGGPPLPSVPTLGGANFLPQPTAVPVTPPVPVSQAYVAQHLAVPSVVTPRVVPTQAQSPDAPAAAATVVPALGRAAGPAQGVPEAYAATAPVAAPVPGLADTAIPAVNPAPPRIDAAPSPFYFLGAGAGLPQTRGLEASPEAALPALDRGLSPTPAVPTTATPTTAADGRPSAAPVASPSTPSFAGAPTPPNAPLPSTPYYFIGESSGYPALAEPARIPGPGFVAGERTEPAPPAPQGASASTPDYTFASRETSSPAALEDAAIPALPATRGAFDVHAVRRDFPILRERVNGRPLVWFDNAATTQKPQSVIDRLAHFYAHENSNIHRAAHELAARATDAYESARNKVAKFLGAASSEEIIFVRGATEGINLVAAAWGRQHVGEGDEIVVSHLEHHANIVPWQMLATEKKAKLRVIPVDDTGQVRLDEYQKLLNDRTRIVAVTQVSNALGTVVPVQKIVEMAHRAGAHVLIDGAQSVSHLRVDMQALGADFFVFSGHKIFGPTGIGVVYGRRAVLEPMQPYQGGGNMIADVTFDKTVYQGVPARFEAGTGNIADAVGLGAALDYVQRLGLENIARYEHELLDYGTACLKTIPGVRLIGTAAEKTSVMSFTLANWSNDEVGKALNQEGVAVRTGHHCAQPILRRFGVETTVRPSVAFYNTFEEIDTMIAVLRRLAAQRR